MNRRNAWKGFSVLLLFLALGLVFPVKAHAFEQKAKTGEWITIRPEGGMGKGRVKFWLKSQSDVTVSIRDVKTAGGHEGSFRLLLDSETDQERTLFYRTASGKTIVTGAVTAQRLAKGTHYVALELEEIESISLRMSVKKTYAAPDFSIGDSKKVSAGKWYRVSQGSKSGGKIRFELSGPSDIQISLKNVRTRTEWKNGVNAGVPGSLQMFLDSTDTAKTEGLLGASGYGTMLYEKSLKLKNLKKGSHYLYFMLEDLDFFQVKISVTKTYSTGDATRIQMPAKKKIVQGSKLKMEPQLVNPYETLTGLTWSSSNDAVASVNRKGVVTAKKAGKAVITCHLKNGKKVSCTVTVVKNAVFHKVSFADSRSGEVNIDWSRLTWNGRSLVMDAVCYNHFSSRVVKYERIEVTVYMGDGKVLAQKTFRNIGLNLASGSRKKLRFTFPANGVKLKNFDLTTGNPMISYDYFFIY